MGSINGVRNLGWHTNILKIETRRALEFLASQKWLKKTRWYFAGGTALALHQGHRLSLDLDFFNPQKDFNIKRLLSHFEKKDWRIDVAQEGTVYGELLGCKVSFIAYPFFVPKEQPKWFGTIRILQPRDIAVMKIIAISQRGRKRDFIDLYWHIIKQESLGDVIRRLPSQYPTVAHNYHHILKSLMYFVDAEQDPMPKIFFDASWRKIKTYFRQEVPRIAKEFLGLT